MPRRGYQTAKRLWSDGIHFVRDATGKDRHPMRFVVGAHKTTASPYSRHAPTLEEGLARAREATARWLKSNPEDRQQWTAFGATEPQASDSVESTEAVSRSGTRLQNSTTHSPIAQPFSITHFNCIVANPVAQVWQCVSRVGERKSAGRPRKDGLPTQVPAITHDIGQCAILLHRDPLRDAAGKVNVYPTWVAAAETALDQYENADEEDRLSWSEGDKRVWATQRIDVIFDPDINGGARPFSLYLPEFRRPIYEDRTKPVPQARAQRIDPGANPQSVIDHRQYRKRQRELHRTPSFEERPLRFRTIYGAIEEAERRERMLKGETI